MERPSLKSLSSLQTRTLSALVMAPVFALIVWFGGWPFTAFLIIASAIALFEWFGMALLLRPRKTQMIIGFAYILLGFYCFYLFRVNFGFAEVLLLVVMVWASDIGAYFFGKTFGGPKMAPTISPNKTWAGLGGAVLCPFIVAVCFLYFVSDMGTWPLLIVSGLAVGLFGQAGDLLVSFMKRKAGVKDSSNLIPGHGGLLDRIDSLLLVAPVFYYLMTHITQVSS
jgi:phosphatidate cytidylyltransferase